MGSPHLTLAEIKEKIQDTYLRLEYDGDPSDILKGVGKRGLYTFRCTLCNSLTNKTSIYSVINKKTVSCGCLRYKRVRESYSRKNPTIKEFREFLRQNTWFTGFFAPHLQNDDEHIDRMDTKDLYTFVCKCGNKVSPSPYSVKSLETRSCGCLRSEKSSEKNVSRYTFADVRGICQLKGWEFLHDNPDADLIYNTHEKWNFKCKCGNNFQIILKDVLCKDTRSCGCIKSINELEVLNYIKSLNVEVLHNNRIIIKPKEIDIYIPSSGLAIEYCGLFWHGERWNKEEARLRHLIKLEECNKKGIRLITIFADEWFNKQNIIKSIISASLGKSNAIKIGARECIVERCSFAEIRQFLTVNHLQGAGSGGICYKLVYNNSIIGCATYGHSTFSRNTALGNNNYELNRYCVDQKYIISGGLNKIQALFIKEYNPEKIISYSDNRYFEGRIYSQLGFKFNGLTPPSYWYFKNGDETNKQHRFNFRKQNLISKFQADPSKTEWEIMQELGYDRIWDCGCKKWVLER